MMDTTPIATHSYKKKFPFRLSVPSFVYPADYATNVRYLGPYVDEIELLFFESDLPSLPTKAQVSELHDLGRQLALTYNVHLPLDLDLGNQESRSRKTAVERQALFIERLIPLTPTTFTLHLQCNLGHSTGDDVIAWQNRTIQSLEELLNLTTVSNRSFSVETLDYAPMWFAPIVDRLNLSVCVDVGHVLRYGFDLQKTLEMFDQRITIFHLHGVADGKDHLSLTQLDPMPGKIMRAYLERYQGTVSLEMFTLKRLRDSLPCLARMLAADKGGE